MAISGIAFLRTKAVILSSKKYKVDNSKFLLQGCPMRWETEFKSNQILTD